MVFCLKTHPGLRVYEIGSITVNISNPNTYPVAKESPSSSRGNKGSAVESNRRKHRVDDDDDEDDGGGGSGGEGPRWKRQTTNCKYRTEAIGIDQKSSKPHPSFMVGV